MYCRMPDGRECQFGWSRGKQGGAKFKKEVFFELVMVGPEIAYAPRLLCCTA